TRLPGGLVSMADELRQRLGSSPQRVIVSTRDGPTPVLVDDGLLTVTVAIALSSTPDTLALIPSVAASGDPTPIAAYFAANFPNFETTSAAFLIESCAEGAGGASKALLEAQAAALPRWRSLVNVAYLDLCDEFALRQVADLTTPPAS